MNELLKYVLICVVSFIISFVGFWGAYLKLYDKIVGCIKSLKEKIGYMI